MMNDIPFPKSDEDAQIMVGLALNYWAPLTLEKGVWHHLAVMVMRNEDGTYTHNPVMEINGAEQLKQPPQAGKGT
jgi:hypothetical protein